MLTIYVARHGEAEGNAEKKLMGQSDSPLTADGKKDAQKLGKSLRSVKFDKIYSSDLKRAYLTANIISEMLNLPFDPIKTEKLREIDSGKCCGMEMRRFSNEYPGSKNDADFRFPKGESYKRFFHRVADFLKQLGKDHDNEIILIVAHEGVIKAIEYYFGCFYFRDQAKIKIPHEYIGKFVIDGGKLANN